jgi:thiamine transport system substrate-binding protein
MLVEEKYSRHAALHRAVFFLTRNRFCLINPQKFPFLEPSRQSRISIHSLLCCNKPILSFFEEDDMKKCMWIILFCMAIFAEGLNPCLASENPPELILMTHDSFSVSKTVVAEFEAKHRIRLRFLKAGDAGAMLNQAILSRNNPMADVIFGVDNTFLSRALEAEMFMPYRSPLLADIAETLKLDPTNRLLPVDFGDVCLNYDKKWFETKSLAPPDGLEDLISPAYSGLTVVENPATSSPGLAFLLATVGHFGTESYLEFWKKLRAGNVLVAAGWEKAYWGHFSAASKGDRPIVVSYASSPAAEVHFAEKPIDQSPTAAVVQKGTCFRQIEFVGILRGTKKADLAKKLVDFMLDRTFQADIPLQMFVYPANKTAILPAVFAKHAKTAKEPVFVAPDEIAAHREEWIEAWIKTVLR